MFKWLVHGSVPWYGFHCTDVQLGLLSVKAEVSEKQKYHRPFHLPPDTHQVPQEPRCLKLLALCVTDDVAIIGHTQLF